MKAAEYLQVHLLEHGFATEGVHAPAEETKVHVEVRAPGGVVRAGLLVVALKAVARGCGRRCGGEGCGDQSSRRLRDFGRIRVTPLPMLIRERRLAGGNCLIWLYHLRISSRKSCMALIRAVMVGWKGRSACAWTAQRRSMVRVGRISRSTRCSRTVRKSVQTSAEVWK